MKKDNDFLDAILLLALVVFVVLLAWSLEFVASTASTNVQPLHQKPQQ